MAHGRRMRSASCASLVVLLLGAGAACSSSTPTTGADADPLETTDSSRAFPVSIEHRYGTTTIEARPQRVVTVGLTDQDPVLALGVAPVGVTEWSGNHPYATWPWAQDELGDAEPEVVGDAATIGFERIAAVRPDLILAVYAGLTQSDYDTLSQIAPTVAQPDEYVDYGVPWDEQTSIIGRALGEQERAQELVDEVQGRFDEARRDHPEFEGATGLVASPYSGKISVYGPQDVRGRFLASLGFVQPPEIEELAGDNFSADISYERADLIDVDALVWMVSSIERDVPQFEAEPLYATLPVHTENRDVFVEYLGELGGATSFVTVLSLPYLLEHMVPKLADAVDGS